MEKKRKKKNACESGEFAGREESGAKKPKLFSAEDFRKELRGGNTIPSLKHFLSLAQQDETVVEDYLEGGGSPMEMLLLLDKTAKTDLTSAIPVFRVLHLLFLRVKGSDSKYYSNAQEGVKFLLESFIPTLRGMLDINSNKHRKVVLKLLTSVVTLFPYFARDVMSLIPDVPSALKLFLGPESSNDSVRKWFIFLILSFIVDGDFELIQNIMNKKGLLSGIINDLKFDEAHTVNVFLSVIKDKILENGKVPKTMKLKVFNTQVITALFDLYDWKSPRNVHISSSSKKEGVKEKEVNLEDKNLVVESVHSFLMVLCTSKKFGIAFTDNTLGNSGELKNGLLSTVVQSLSEPWENKKISEIIIGIIVSCPDLMTVMLSRMETAIQPRESKKWNLLLQFLEKLLLRISPKKILAGAHESAEIDVVSIAKNLCAPGLLVRNVSAGLRCGPTCSPILYYSMRLFTVMWKNVEEVLFAFRGNQKLRKTLISSFSNCVMDAEELLAIWQNICAHKSWILFDTIDKQSFLNVVLDFLEMTGKCEKTVMDSPSLIASKMLEMLDPVQESATEIDYVNIQMRVFYLLASIDPMSVTPDSDLFKKAVTLLLSNKSRETVESVAKIILSTGVFENNESEIDIWLACFFDDFVYYQVAVPNLIADAVSRLYLKEMDVNEFVIESSVKKKSIFEELMETDTNVVVKRKWTSNLAETPTPMLSKSLELMLAMEIGRERDAIQRYLANVALRLFHYYNNGRGIVKICQGCENELSPTLLEYFTESDTVSITEDQLIFMSDVERKLLTWLRGKIRINLEELLKNEGTSPLRLFLTFNTLTSYLIRRVRTDSLSDDDVSKLMKLFGYSLGLRTSEAREMSRDIVLSYDISNQTHIRGKYIHTFLSLPFVDKFDVCEYENETAKNFTRLALSILMEVDVGTDDSLLRPWKRKFIETMRSNLRDSSKTLEVFRSVEPLFHCFRYSPEEYSHIIAEYCHVTDMKNFASNGNATMSTMVLTKLVKLQSDYSDPNQRVINHLWKITKYMMEAAPKCLSIMDDCFVHILRNRPKTLSLLGTDFLERFLERSDFDDNVAVLGTLLLSDPTKAEHSLAFAINNFKDLKNKKVIASMMSALVLEDGSNDPFLSFLRSKKLYLFWTESELDDVAKESVASELGKLIYRKYRSHIIGAKTNKQEFISRYCRLFSLITKHYHEKEDILGIVDSLREGSFAPEVLHETLLMYKDDDEIVQSYARGLLVMFVRRLKEEEGKECDMDFWTAYAKYATDLANVGNAYEWSAITEDATWKDFVRNALRTGFNVSNGGSIVGTLRSFVELFYKSVDSHRDVAFIFNMLISHSQFLSVMLHRRSHLKHEIISLYLQLVTRNPSVLSAKHVPVILAAYSASLSETDRTLLKILRFYENNSIDLSEYEPFVWSDSAANHYSVKSNVGVSLWRRINMLNVMDLLDGKRMRESFLRFPVSGKGDDECLYDPEFLLPLFGNLLSPGSITYCMSFIQKGCLAYVICALSSMSKEVRLAASSVLARFYNHLELVQTTKLKFVWLHFINCLRYGVGDIAVHPVPSVVTQFLARTSLELSGEPGDMFTSLQKFLLAKPVFKLDYVPEFLPLFHSSDIYYAKQRRWILEILRDGLKENIDFDLVYQTVAVKMILSYFKSQFCNRDSKSLVLQVLINGLEIDKSKLLISEYGLLSWLQAVAPTCDKELFHPFVRLVSSVAGVALKKLVGNSLKRRNLFYPVQILNILVRSLSNLAECRSAETFRTFLNIVLDSLLVLAKFRQRNWCKLNEKTFRNELTRIVSNMTGDDCLAEKVANSRTFFAAAGIEDLYRRISFLWDVISGFDSARDNSLDSR